MHQEDEILALVRNDVVNDAIGQRAWADELQSPLPPNAVRMRIHSVQWRMDRTKVDKWLRRAPEAALMGPFRKPWEFGYVMVSTRQDLPSSTP